MANDANQMLGEILRDPIGALRMARDSFTKLGWGEVRTFGEFFEEFKPPSNLEDRMSTNLMYYRTNYAILVVGCMLVSVASSPFTLLIALLGVLIAAVTLVRTKNVSAAGAVLGFVALMSSTRLMMGLLLGLLGTLAHLLFRTRSIKSRVSAAMDERKL
eukprot:TRINITY_DN17445_c0_g1_i2.p1 TRINITY_DN17445_c0_g1~~TRINITY_DN17445_c0_g1_i2.p1  ORF type:complete len:159 (+),score=22.59 TRINITY_DN17445_c0_g1_i2:171-647(+)